MIFSNPQILRNCNDLKIGGIMVDNTDISFLDYIGSLRIRILKLVIDFVKTDMSEGASKEDSIKDCLALVYSTLHFNDTKTYPTDSMGIVLEIENSEEFQNWEASIKDRFLDIHEGVVTLSTPIPAVGRIHPSIMTETVELIQQDDAFQVFLDGLSATNYIE